MKDIEALAKEYSEFHYTNENGNDCYDYFEFNQEGLKAFGKALQGDGEPVAYKMVGVNDHEGMSFLKELKPKKYNKNWWKVVPLYTSPPNTQAKLDKAEARIKELEDEVKRLTEIADGLLNHCDKENGECSECAKIVCPHKEPFHFHHDGCPACAIAEQAITDKG